MLPNRFNVSHGPQLPLLPDSTTAGCVSLHDGMPKQRDLQRAVMRLQLLRRAGVLLHGVICREHNRHRRKPGGFHHQRRHQLRLPPSDSSPGSELPKHAGATRNLRSVCGTKAWAEQTSVAHHRVVQYRGRLARQAAIRLTRRSPCSCRPVWNSEKNSSNCRRTRYWRSRTLQTSFMICGHDPCPDPPSPRSRESIFFNASGAIRASPNMQSSTAQTTTGPNRDTRVVPWPGLCHRPLRDNAGQFRLACARSAQCHGCRHFANQMHLKRSEDSSRTNT